MKLCFTVVRQVRWRGRALTCDSAHSWQLYSTVSLELEAAGTMTCYPSMAHYPDTQPTNPCPVLIMLSARLGSDMYQFSKSLVWLNQSSKTVRSRFEPITFRFLDLPEREADALLIRPPQLVNRICHYWSPLCIAWWHACNHYISMPSLQISPDQVSCLK